MSDPVQKLSFGQEVVIEGRRYEVVSDPEFGARLEPAITLSIDDIHRLNGSRPMTAAEVDEFFGDVPFDEEG